MTMSAILTLLLLFQLYLGMEDENEPIEEFIDVFGVLSIENRPPINTMNVRNNDDYRISNRVYEKTNRNNGKKPNNLIEKAAHSKSYEIKKNCYAQTKDMFQTKQTEDTSFPKITFGHNNYDSNQRMPNNVPFYEESDRNNEKKVEEPTERIGYSKSHKITKMMAKQKIDKVFGGSILFCNMREGQKIKAAHWKNEYIVQPIERCFPQSKKQKKQNEYLNLPNNWEFTPEQEAKEAKEALEEYGYSVNLEMYANLYIPTEWIPTSASSVIEEYDTEKKAEQAKENCREMRNSEISKNLWKPRQDKKRSQCKIEISDKNVNNKTQDNAAKFKTARTTIQQKTDEIMTKKLHLLEKNRNSLQNLNKENSVRNFDMMKMHFVSPKWQHTLPNASKAFLLETDSKIKHSELTDLTKVNESVARDFQLLRENFLDERLRKKNEQTHKTEAETSEERAMKLNQEEDNWKKAQKSKKLVNIIELETSKSGKYGYNWSVSNKEESEVLDCPLTSFILSERFEARLLNRSNIGEKIIVAHAKDVILQEVEKVGETIIVRAIHGKAKGKTDKITPDTKLIKVISKFEDEELDEMFKIKKFEIGNIQGKIEENLLKVCMQQEERDFFCDTKIKEWQSISQNGDIDYNDNKMLSLNEQIFHAENKRRKMSEFNDTIEEKIFETNPEQNKSLELDRVLLVWLEIKAQAFGQKFAKCMARKSKDARKQYEQHPRKYLKLMKELFKTGLKLDDLVSNSLAKNRLKRKREEAQIDEMCIVQEISGCLTPSNNVIYNEISPNAEELLHELYSENEGFNFQRLYNWEAVSKDNNDMLDDMDKIETNVKKYMKNVESSGLPDSKVQTGESYAANIGAFVVKETEKCEVVGIWSGGLFSTRHDNNLFTPGGSKAGRTSYIVELHNNEFILDPKAPHGSVNDCQNERNFLNAMTELNEEETQRFNLGWLEFKYKGIPYMAEIALRKITPGNAVPSDASTDVSNSSEKKFAKSSELFTSYGEYYVPAIHEPCDKDAENRAEILDKMNTKVKNILGKKIGKEKKVRSSNFMNKYWK